MNTPDCISKNLKNEESLPVTEDVSLNLFPRSDDFVHSARRKRLFPGGRRQRRFLGGLPEKLSHDDLRLQMQLYLKADVFITKLKNCEETLNFGREEKINCCTYSIHPKAGRSGIQMVNSPTLFESGFRIASLDRFKVKTKFYSCQNGLG